MMMLGASGAIALGGVLGTVGAAAAVLAGIGMAIGWALSGHQLAERLAR